MDGSSPTQREFRLHLFGGPVLERRGAPVGMSPFHGVLLSILAYHGRRGIRRERLLSFLWPSGAEGVLRRRLSQALYSLHQRIGVAELVVASADRFYLDVDRVEPDLEHFHTALHERRIEAASTLLAREFLGEVNPFPTPELEIWVHERVRQFRADIRTAGARVWGEAEQRGDWERAAQTTRILMSVDPTDEEFLRKHLRALGLLGQVEEARAAYLAFSEHAEEEDPRWRPAEATQQLLARLDTLARERGPTFLLGRYGLPAQPPLVGRVDEMATLGAVLRDPADDRVQTVSIVGEPGVGKTRLAWEALRTLPFDGVRVLSASCSEFERRIPLSPFASALKPAWVADTARTLEDPWRAVLLSIFPEWHLGAGPPPPVPQIEPSEVPRRLCEAFRQLFMALVRTDPVVLFIDDFHWVDETALSVLDYIRQRGVGGDLKIVVTMEQGGVPQREAPHVGKSAARWINRDRAAIRLVLPQLTEDQGIQLAIECQRLLGCEVDAEAVLRISGRSPLLISETINNWDLVQRVETRGVEHLPSAFQQVVITPIKELPPHERRVLNLIAVAIRPIPAVALTDYLSTSEAADSLKALESLLGRRMVELADDGFRPAYDLLAWSVRQSMPTTERITFHRRFAEGLFNQTTEAVVLAHYARGCQDFATASCAYRRAAETAWTAGAGQEAIQLLQEALATCRDASDAESLRIEIAEAFVHARIWEEAIPYLRDSEELLLQRGDLRAALTHRAQRLGAMLIADPEASDTALSEAWRCVNQAERAGCPEPAAIGMDFIARESLARSNHEDLREVIQRASALLAQAPPTETAIRLLMILSMQSYLGEGPSALSAAEDAVILSRDVPDVTLRVRALNRLLVLSGIEGTLNLDAGQEALSEAMSLASQSGDLRERLQPSINLGVWLMRSGDYHRSLSIFEEVEPQITGLGDRDLEARLWCNVGIVRLRLGDADSAVQALAQAREKLPPRVPPEGQAHVFAALGWAYLMAGRMSKAREMMEIVETIPIGPAVDPVILAGFRGRFEARYRRFAEAERVFLTHATESQRHYPISAVDLVAQRMEVLGRRMGSQGWEDLLGWANEFCEARRLGSLKSALSWAQRRAKD